MKDIPYNGDLSEDIYYLDNTFNLKEEVIFKGIFNFSILTIIGLFAFSFGVIPFNLVSLLVYIVSCLGVNTLYTIIDITRKKRSMKLKLAKANSNIYSLIENLDKNNISTSKEKIIDAEIKEKVTKSKTKDDNGNLLSKENKIIEYFYLLDNNDKIQVLKQIKRSITSNKSKINCVSLALLEDKDLEGKELPVRKTLVTKKKKR
ncbi:MAG: hypothetical protein ACI4U4_03875 [Bacilli bacterium]